MQIAGMMFVIRGVAVIAHLIRSRFDFIIERISAKMAHTKLGQHHGERDLSCMTCFPFSHNLHSKRDSPGPGRKKIGRFVLNITIGPIIAAYGAGYLVLHVPWNSSISRVGHALHPARPASPYIKKTRFLPHVSCHAFDIARTRNENEWALQLLFLRVEQIVEVSNSNCASGHTVQDFNSGYQSSLRLSDLSLRSGLDLKDRHAQDDPDVALLPPPRHRLRQSKTA